MATTTITQTRSRTNAASKSSTTSSAPSYYKPDPSSPAYSNSTANRLGSLLHTSAQPAQPASTFYLHQKISPLYNARDTTQKEFTWSNADEPHSQRRKVILAAHPEILELYGTEPLTFPLVFSISALQLVMAYWMSDAHWLLMLVCAWGVSGTLNHSLQTAVHELSHNLCWESPTANKWTAIMCNLVTGFPSSISFQRYHYDHHHSLGVDEIDPDVPTDAEANFFINSALKVFWLTLQPFFYAFRPTLIRPKPFGLWELINFVVVIGFDFVVLYFLGIKAVLYMMLGTLFGLGFHPAAAHLIAEHYETVSGQETYSYYGSANYLNFNVGYHNEHHDFPRIPWSRLPELTKIAPEYYLSLPYYTSYLRLLWAYVTDNELGPHARIKRANPVKERSKMDKLPVQDGGKRAHLPDRRSLTYIWIGIIAVWTIAVLGYTAFVVLSQQ